MAHQPNITMAKRFKLKLSRLIPSFKFCRSKDTSSLPSDPVPSCLGLSPAVNLHPPAKSPHHSIKHRASSVCTSVGCGLSSSSTDNASDADRFKSPWLPPTPVFYWERDDKWHAVAKVYEENCPPRRKIYNSCYSGDYMNEVHVVLPSPPTPSLTRRKRRVKKKKTTPRTRISTSSADSELFSSEGFDDDKDVKNEETETLVSSSRSFSANSLSKFVKPHLETIHESPFNSRKKVKKERRSSSRKRARRNKLRKSFESLSPARLSRFQWLIPCTVDGKVKESCAVLKKSNDPHQDFKRSMIEMIIEKQMFEDKDLEQLLHCFLSLNSRHHHVVIVEAFAEIWEAFFCRRSISHALSRDH